MLHKSDRRLKCDKYCSDSNLKCELGRVEGNFFCSYQLPLETKTKDRDKIEKQQQTDIRHPVDDPVSKSKSVSVELQVLLSGKTC